MFTAFCTILGLYFLISITRVNISIDFFFEMSSIKGSIAKYVPVRPIPALKNVLFNKNHLINYLIKLKMKFISKMFEINLQ